MSVFPRGAAFCRHRFLRPSLHKDVLDWNTADSRNGDRRFGPEAMGHMSTRKRLDVLRPARQAMRPLHSPAGYDDQAKASTHDPRGVANRHPNYLDNHHPRPTNLAALATGERTPRTVMQ